MIQRFSMADVGFCLGLMVFAGCAFGQPQTAPSSLSTSTAPSASDVMNALAAANQADKDALAARKALDSACEHSSPNSTTQNLCAETHFLPRKGALKEKQADCDQLRSAYNSTARRAPASVFQGRDLPRQITEAYTNPLTTNAFKCGRD